MHKLILKFKSLVIFFAFQLVCLFLLLFVCFLFWAGVRPLPTGSPQNLSSNRQKLEGLWGARLKGERGFCPPISMQCAVPISLAPTPRSVESTDTCGRGDDFAFQHRD